MIQKKYLAPNGCTLSSLTVGLIAIQQVVNSNYIQACWLITLCMVFDLFDGSLARRFQAYSDFGAQLDSLVDFVSFGIAPAFLAYNMLLIQKPLFGGILSIFYVICAASRLAKFNSNLDDFRSQARFQRITRPSSCGSGRLLHHLQPSTPSQDVFLQPDRRNLDLRASEPSKRSNTMQRVISQQAWM